MCSVAIDKDTNEIFLWVNKSANLSVASFSGAAIDVFDDDSVDDDDIDDFLRRFNVPGTEKILSN